MRRQSPGAALLLCAALLGPAAAASPGALSGTSAPAEASARWAPLYAEVLARHDADGARLRAAGLVFRRGLCYRLDASGHPAGKALTPEELDAALSAAPDAPAHADWSAGLRAPAVPQDLMQAAAAQSQEALDSLYNGKAPPMPEPSDADFASGPAAQPAPAWTEPDYDGAVGPSARNLLRGRRVAEAVHGLAESFQPDPASATGLSDDAAQAWRALAAGLMQGKGGAAARRELQREVVLVSKLTPEQKKAFAAQIQSPLPVYYTLTVSRAPHFAESQLYFSRMTALLREQGLTLGDYIRQVDPKERYAAPFLLRAHAYDALLPYINRNPAQAAAVASYLFSNQRPGWIRAEAAHIEGLAVSLAASGRGSAADAFAKRVLDVASTRGPAAPAAALFLRMNADLFPAQRLRIEDELPVPDALLRDPRLSPPDPASAWPQGRITFVLYFPYHDSFMGWLRYFQKHGYAVQQNDAAGVHLYKEIAGTEVNLVAKVFNGDPEGFLEGEEARRFLKTVKADLRDPSIQGVVTRTHAQFYYPALFQRGQTRDKVWLDGSCRGSWYQEEYEKRCENCAVVNNTATGMGEITDPALYEILEGLARGEDWAAIYKRIQKPLPRGAARFMGPWTPRFWTALDLQKKSRRRQEPSNNPGSLSAE